MPTLRELTEAIQRRPGVKTVVILGADGLVIETRDADHAHAEAIAARVPAVTIAARQLGNSAEVGDARLTLMEFDDGYGVVLRLSDHASLFVSASADVALGDLLFDIRRHRAPMASLV